MSILSKIQNLVGQVGDAIVPGNQSSWHPQQPSQPQLPIYTQGGPSANVNNVQHVWGTAVAQNTADQQGYAPWFRSLLQGTNPSVDNLPASLGAGGLYSPGINAIHLNSNQLDPYTVTHEALHAAFDRKSPQAQRAFASVAQQATPDQIRVLNSTEQLGNNIYQGNHPLTEVHSFLPQYGQGSPTQAYYQHYFSNPNFYQEPQTRYAVGRASGMDDLLFPHRAAQFSDWQENQ